MDTNLLAQLADYRRKFDGYEKIDGYWSTIHNPDDAGLASVSYGDIKPDLSGPYIEAPYSTWSDYSGSTAERSNCRVLSDMLKDKPGVYPIYGGYSTTGLLISMEYLESDSDLQDTLADLFNYPVINEDDWSQLECEIEDEDWASWIKYDLQHELDSRDIAYPDDDAKLYELYRRAMNAAHEYPIFEDAVSCYIHIDKIVDNWPS
jgi:hypothetical protein